MKAVSAATEDRSVLRWLSNRWMDGARPRPRDRERMLARIGRRAVDGACVARANTAQQLERIGSVTEMMM
jgi:hypothetical protein